MFINIFIPPNLYLVEWQAERRPVCSTYPLLQVELPESKSPVRFYPLLTARNLALQDTGPGSLSQAEQSELTVAERKKLETLLNHSFGTYQVCNYVQDISSHVHNCITCLQLQTKVLSGL